ncbi:MAG: rhodanese-like domain-containing protein [Deinococcales bacterium]|nr:rhodanese-like domain-containing protein [Deinococcales bacterium]
MRGPSCRVGACPLQRVLGWVFGLFDRKGDVMYQEIFAEELGAWRGRGARVVDVRERWEYEAGHIPGSENVPLDALASLKLDGKPIVLVCASGNRSGYAAQLLAQRGFTEVANLLGGTAGWARQGRELTRGRG